VAESYDVETALTWSGDLRFSARSEAAALEMDGDGKAGITPVQTLALSLLGCMSADVVHILTKARLPISGLEARFLGVRAPANPRRFTRIRLHFQVAGAVPAERVEHAIALSRETYCSVWHSLSPDIELQTSFEIVPATS